MAARKLRPFHQEEVKQKIQASQLINRVQDHALGYVDMTASQLHAAIKLLEFRLSKALPDVVEENLQHQATAQLQANQLRLMAMEMLAQQEKVVQGDTINQIETSNRVESVIQSIPQSTDSILEYSECCEKTTFPE